MSTFNKDLATHVFMTNIPTSCKQGKLPYKKIVDSVNYVLTLGRDSLMAALKITD